MRTSSLALVVVGALALVGVGGWVTIGHSEEKKTTAVVLGPPVGQVTISVPNGQLTFNPKSVQAPYNPSAPNGLTVIKVNYHDEGAATHTLQFQDPTVVWTLLQINNAGETVSGSAGFPKAGDYTFFCTIPGHQAAGMQGTLTITSSLKPHPVAGAVSTATTKGG
jgi:nitrite reductase (NO-forming)